MMNINPLFLNSLGGQAIETDLKNKKFDAPAYLFSDIIKIYTDDKNTDMTAPVDMKDSKDLGAGESGEVVDLNSLFEQVNKKIESPFSNTENSDLSNVEDSNVTVFKYVFEELGSSESVDTENELKLTGDDSTHISDVDINALVSNIINLIQNSGIASSFDKNFNSDSINAFLSNGGNVDLNIETSDGVIKLSFEQNGTGNGNASNNIKFPGITPPADGNSAEVPKVLTEENTSGTPVSEDNSKQMSLKISVYKDAVMPEQNISLNSGTKQVDNKNINIVNSSDTKSSVFNSSENNAVNNQNTVANIPIDGAALTADTASNDSYIGTQSSSETGASLNTDAQLNSANKTGNDQKSADTNIIDSGNEIKVEPEILNENKGTEKSGDAQSFANTLAKDKNIAEISYKEEKISPSGNNESVKTDAKQEAVKEFQDLPLFAETEDIENKQSNISQNTNVSKDAAGNVGQTDVKVNNSNQIVAGSELDATTNNVTEKVITAEIQSNNQNPANINPPDENKLSEKISTDIKKTQTTSNNIIDGGAETEIKSNTYSGVNINETVKRFINNIIKVKEKVVSPEIEEKPVIQTNNNTAGTVLDNIDHNKIQEDTDNKTIVQPVENKGKTDEKNVDIQPKVQTETNNTGLNQETVNPVNSKIIPENKNAETDIKTTRQFDIKLNGNRRMSSVDLLSKVHKFISDNTFAEKQVSKDSESVNNTVNNTGTDNSTTYLNNLSEFTQSADISLLNNKSNFVLQKQNYKDNNKENLKNNSESIGDLNTQIKTDVKKETVHVSAEDEKTKKNDITGIDSKETVKTSAEDKILTDAEEKIKQNLPVNEKKVFTPDLSLVNPFGSRENSKVEVSKNSNNTLKVSDVSESSTKNVEKSNPENNTGKEGKDNGNSTAFNLNHTAPERVSDKANTIHEEMKFTQPDEKVVKYSKLMPEIKNALSEGVNKSLTISLTPEELGKVKLIVETVDKTVSAKIEVQNESVQTTVQNNLENLKQSLSQSGLNINNITVSISYNDNRQQKPGELKKKHTSGNDKKIETEEEKISSNKNTSKTLGYNTYEYLA